MRVIWNRLVRFVALGSIVFAYMGLNAPPAAAFASTGHVTIEGGYEYWADYYWGYLTIWSDICVDSWAGTTTTSAGTGASCWLYLFGGSRGSNMQLDGWYSMSGGSHAYALRINTDPPAAYGPGTATGTATASYGYYQGPVVVGYTLTMTSDCTTADIIYGCSPYYYWSRGAVTLTLEYTVH